MSGKLPEIRDPFANCDEVENTPDNATPEDPDEYGRKRRKMHFQEDVWLYWVRIGFLIATSLGTFGVISVYMWHLVAPANWRWLCEPDIMKLKDLAITIIVGLVMSITTSYFFKKEHTK